MLSMRTATDCTVLLPRRFDQEAKLLNGISFSGGGSTYKYSFSTDHQKSEGISESSSVVLDGECPWLNRVGVARARWLLLIR